MKAAGDNDGLEDCQGYTDFPCCILYFPCCCRPPHCWGSLSGWSAKDTPGPDPPVTTAPNSSMFSYIPYFRKPPKHGVSLKTRQYRFWHVSNELVDEAPYVKVNLWNHLKPDLRESTPTHRLSWPGWFLTLGPTHKGKCSCIYYIYSRYGGSINRPFSPEASPGIWSEGHVTVPFPARARHRTRRLNHGKANTC